MGFETQKFNTPEKKQNSSEYLPGLSPERKRELIDAKNALKEVVENIPHNKLKTMINGLTLDFIEGCDGDVNKYAKLMLESESVGNDPDVAAFHVAEKLSQIKEILSL